MTLHSTALSVADRLPFGAGERLRGPGGQTLWRYSVASIVAVIVSEICLIIFNGAIGISAWVSSSLATAIAAVPNYYMNRKWAWGKNGRSHLLKEVLPFWSLAFAGWALSTYSVYLMEGYAKDQRFPHVWTTTLVAIVYVAAFGVLWIGKFIIFNKLMFVHRHHQHHLDAHEAPVGSGERAVRIPG
ncbi:MAG TPA: GtrA family protein [Acidimicrobiales bacterium]|nr:GtrA family protein [Acidimicrobiales bacterium]